MAEQEIRLVLRITARTTFLLFAGAFTADALFALWPTKLAEWLVPNRDRFILGFAASHTVHLGAIIALLITVPVIPRREIYVLFVGGFVFLLLYGLAAAAIARSVGRKLPVVGSAGFESFAMYTIWLVFASGFVPRMVKGWPIYSVLGVIALAAIVVRVAGGARRARAAMATG